MMAKRLRSTFDYFAFHIGDDLFKRRAEGIYFGADGGRRLGGDGMNTSRLGFGAGDPELYPE